MVSQAFDEWVSTLEWRKLITIVAEFIALANTVGDRVGTRFGLHLGVRVTDLYGHIPERLFQDQREDERAVQAGFYDPTAFQEHQYQASTVLSAAQCRGDLTPVMHVLFSPLFNSLGLPAIPEMPHPVV